MKAIYADDMTKLDLYSQEYIKSIDLMESAGMAMADIIKSFNPKKPLVILGSGGNAGDGLVVARALFESGIDVSIYMCSEIKNKDSLFNLEKYKGKIISKLDDLKDFDVIVDAILGNGLKTPLKGNISQIIDIINNSGKKIISLDVPSGLNSDNGLSMGGYVIPDVLITVEYPKVGFFLNDGMNCINDLRIIKCSMKDPGEIGIKLIDISDIDMLKNMVPKRLRNSNKGSYGRASLIAGSRMYSGASMISYNALCAFMMGVGYSRLYVPKNLFDQYTLKHPEIIVSMLDDNDGFIKYNENDLNQIIKNSDSIAIGMGMGVSNDLYESINYLLENYDKDLIIDADGLNSISKYGVDILKNHKAKVVITPHPKEFSRLSGIDAPEILKDPIRHAMDFAKKYNITVILKGSSTIVTDGDNVAINIFGSTGLAKGGSGDALSGILAGAFGYLDENVFNKALFGVSMLGFSAELSNIPYECVSICDIIKELPNAWKRVKGE